MNREQLVEQLQPIFDDFVDRIAAAIPDLVRAELVATIGRLTEPQTTPAKKTRAPKTQREPKPAKPAKGERKPMSCNKCGAVGFTSRTCGKTHNVEETDAEESETVDTKPPSTAAVSIASLRSKRQPARAAATKRDDESGDVPLHEVVAFTF